MKKCGRFILGLALLGLSIFILPSISFGAPGNQCSSYILSKPKFFSADNPWFKSEAMLAVTKIFANISPWDAKPGAIVAAQTRENPDYYYHWVRDGALTIDSLIRAYRRSGDPFQRQQIYLKIGQYMSFSEGNQMTYTLTGDGEPKFYVSGKPYNFSWGRPQNDGPALRAIALTHWFQVLQSEGMTDDVRNRLYDGKIPANSLIKRDLEYIAWNWTRPCFDIWEEVMGDHFYTRLVQRRALIEGAKLARSLGDGGAADFYEAQAKLIEARMMDFWDPKAGIFVATINRVGGLDYKTSGIDSAVGLGLLHGSLDDGFLSWDDPKVQSTIQVHIQAFKNLYPINQDPKSPGVAIGRYPEDMYAGSNFNGGNPWVLSTLGYGEIHYKMANLAKRKGQFNLVQNLIDMGDQFIACVQYHANTDGSLNEQMNRVTGFMTSVTDLTWNYAAVITAYFTRDEFLNGLVDETKKAIKKINFFGI